MATLFSSTRTAVSLDDVLKECASVFKGGGTALVYGPRDCAFARLGVNGQLAFSPDRPWPEGEPVFEARVFSPSVELRWLHKEGGKGKAVLLTESVGLLERMDMWDKGDEIVTTEPIGDSHDMDIRYLLWGTGTGEAVAEGWSRLAEPRIGTLDVPVMGVEKRRHAFLVAREYVVAEDGNDGNAEVAEERLMEVKHE
jgi:CRISPR-associated protein (TIGR03984 family)